MTDAINASSLLHERQLSVVNRRTAFTALLHQYVARFPSLLLERQAPAAVLKPYDKVFATAWLGENIAAVGTKCNSFLLVNTSTCTVRSIALPTAPARSSSSPPNPHGSCGIHAIAINPSGTLLATGGLQAEDCVVMELPSCRPVQTFVGHSDWVFGIAWLTDLHVATGSRDKTIKLWKVQAGEYSVSYAELVTASRHQGKVRDLNYSTDLMRMVSLGTEGVVTTWDARGGQVQSVSLPGCKSPVCLALDGPLVAAGGAGGAALLDIRTPATTGFLLSLDPEGVRSISFNQHLLTCGGGSGSLFFYDMRTHAIVDVATTSFDGAGTAQHSTHSTGLPMDSMGLKLGPGYIAQNETYREHMHHLQLAPACYAHCWDEYGTRLFAAGGPNVFGLRGCYMAMWE